MSDHLLRDLADPQYRLWHEIKKNLIPRPTDQFLPGGLFPYFGSIEFSNTNVNRIYCRECGKDLEKVGILWIPMKQDWAAPNWFTVWTFCPNCHWVISRVGGMRNTEKTT